MCPTKEAVVEVLPVQKCKTDKECSPRICCPDGQFSYCRTPIPHVGETFIPRIMKYCNKLLSVVDSVNCLPTSLRKEEIVLILRLVDITYV
ncbi:hypothetical protein RUM43_007905 [Polyplax serrata]|uniref:Uncharacterized protein n=1 Tax=Polyplax serrata TaxID=468196 RepID=A0AAN8S853_POLSC